MKGLRGLISFGGFGSYKEMALRVGGKFGARLVGDDYAPRDYVKKLSPIPVFFIYGVKDGVVPLSQARELLRRRRNPRPLSRLRRVITMMLSGSTTKPAWKIS